MEGWCERRYQAMNYLEKVFLLLQTIFYFSFLYLDITNGSIRLSIVIKYTIIILCFCYALLAGSACKGIVFFTPKEQLAAGGFAVADTLLLQVGLFFTMISDLFILVLDYYLYGVLVFLIVQQLYSLRLVLLKADNSGKTTNLSIKEQRSNLRLRYLKRLILQVGIALTVCLVLMIGKVTLDRLLVISVFYFICILTNTITAIRLVVKDPGSKSNLLYGIGMLLFLMCDINVGLFNLSGFITMPEEIYGVIFSISSILMWTFYAPSQILIALSSHYTKLRKLGGH